MQSVLELLGTVEEEALFRICDLVIDRDTAGALTYLGELAERGHDLGCLVLVAEPEPAGGEVAECARDGHGRGRRGAPHRSKTPRSRRAERDDPSNRRRSRDARQPAQSRGAAGRVSDPGERRAVGFFAHARNQRGRVVQHPVFERPGTAPRLARTVSVMTQIGEPDIQTGGAEKMRQPAGSRFSAAIGPVGRMQPKPVVGEGAVYQQHGGPAIPMSAQAVQGQFHAVGRRDAACASRHSYRPATR